MKLTHTHQKKVRQRLFTLNINLWRGFRIMHIIRIQGTCHKSIIHKKTWLVLDKNQPSAWCLIWIFEHVPIRHFPLDVKIGKVLLKYRVFFVCLFVLMSFHSLEFSSMECFIAWFRSLFTKVPIYPFSTPLPNYASLTPSYYENSVRDCDVNCRKSNASWVRQISFIKYTKTIKICKSNVTLHMQIRFSFIYFRRVPEPHPSPLIQCEFSQ